MAVIVDSSVWIAAAKPHLPECLKLKRLLTGNAEVFVARPIQAEVCQGARTEAQFQQLWESFLGLQFLEIEDRHWGLTAWNYFRCRKKGRTPSTLDCLIGTLAREYALPLWTLDKHRQGISPILGFDLWDGKK